MNITSFSQNGQPQYDDLLENIKNANAIYVHQKQQILFLESALFEAQAQAGQLTLSITSCNKQSEQLMVAVGDLQQKEIEYKGIIKQHKTKETIYQTALGATLAYIIYNLIFK